jgi:hypothetical protein
VYLTGSHTWTNLKDIGTSDPPAAFNFAGYLETLLRYHHNFFRLWSWELTTYTYDGPLKYAVPSPWQRVGPGTALDGKPKFDLSVFNEEYFDRLRARVASARDRGVYVSIMLFEGHALQASRPPWCWSGHPFNARNNVNGIDGDPNQDGRGLEIHTLHIPSVTALQEAYVRRVIDTVNDLDNVLYEIANESHSSSNAWQLHMVDFIHAYETRRPKQHPVVFTGAWGYDGSELWKSRAEAISPGWPHPNATLVPYRDAPPANNGTKVIFNDTDHLWGAGGTREWVWKSFLRGLNPIFMDPYDDVVNGEVGVWRQSVALLRIRLHHLRQLAAGRSVESIGWKESIRRNMGYTRTYALRINLAAMVPRNDLATSRYCLANPGREYLVYIPHGGAVEVDLSAARGIMSVEWFSPQTGGTSPGAPIPGGTRRAFRAPFNGDAVLYLKTT